MSQTPVSITPGSGAASVAAELVGGTSYQQIEVYGPGGSSVLSINPDGSFGASIIGIPTVKITGSPSISGAVTVIGTPSISGSISFIGIPSISGSVTIIGTSSISGSVTVTGTPSISGAVTVIGNPSISGTVNVAGLQGVSVSGTVNITGTPSISGTVNLGGLPISTTNTGSVLVMLSPVASLVSATSSVITSTSQTSVLARSPGGQFNYLSTLLVTNQQTSVTGAGTQVNIIDDGSGQVLWAGYAAAGGGGFAQSFVPALRQPTSTFSLSAKAASQASVIVAMSGYTAP